MAAQGHGGGGQQPSTAYLHSSHVQGFQAKLWLWLGQFVAVYLVVPCQFDPDCQPLGSQSETRGGVGEEGEGGGQGEGEALHHQHTQAIVHLH